MMFSLDRRRRSGYTTVAMHMRASKRCAIGILAAATIAWFAPDGVAQQDYCLTDIGTLGGSFSQAWDINTKEQVVGLAATQGAPGIYCAHAFFWEKGRTTDMGAFAPCRGGVPSSYAHSINDSGWVVGSSDLGTTRFAFLVIPADTDGDGRPDLWFQDADRNGINDLMQNLGALPGFISSEAWGINNSGQIVGGSIGPLSVSRAFLWEEGVMRDIGPGSASAINNLGQVTLVESMWDRDRIYPLGSLGQGHTNAVDINDLGQIVGSSKPPEGTAKHGFVLTPRDTDGDGRPDLWNEDTNGDSVNDLMVDMGAFSVYGINNKGEVCGDTGPYRWTKADGKLYLDEAIPRGLTRAIGYAYSAPSDTSDSPLVSRFGPYTIGWDLVLAWKINEEEQIVGWGRIDTGIDARAFLLRPALVLEGPSPSLPDTVNTFEVSEAPPGADVHLMYSFEFGTSYLPVCFWAGVNLDSPVHAVQAVADDSGHASLQLFVPPTFSGKKVLIQAVESSGCTVSNLVEATFP